MALIDIGKAPTPENSALLLHREDHVAVARVPLAPGSALSIRGETILVRHFIPAGHKVAIAAVRAGQMVHRYGESIGRATQSIEPGEHVHTHNLAFEELNLAYEFPAGEIPLPEAPSDAPTFLGYSREDGRAGTRNYVAIVAASNCAAHTAELTARSFEGQKLPPNVDGVVAFPHGDGCGHAIGPDTIQFQRTLAGIIAHPNVGGAVILGLGCEVNLIDHYLGDNAPRPSGLVGMTLQDSGGTRATVEAARNQIAGLFDKMTAQTRQPLPASKIVLGLNCGGSDSFSGITANPALGICSDILAGFGGTAVLAETPEIFGAEHLLVKRSRNRQVAERLLSFIRSYKEYLARFGESFDDNPSPGNKEGGLTNILEKSLGAVAKGGSSTMNDAVDYAERVHTPGFVFMNTPGYDPVSLAGLAAGGSNVIAFTTGRGSAIGFPCIPVIKIASNSHTYRRMTDNMDINAGAVADGEKSLAEVGREIFSLVLAVASGQRIAAERWGHREFVPWRIGPTM